MFNFNKPSAPGRISTHFLHGEFPSCWTVTNVQTVPKKSAVTNLNNYRPIELYSALFKVMESPINFHLVNYWKRNELLNDHQYGLALPVT